MEPPKMLFTNWALLGWFTSVYLFFTKKNSGLDQKAKKRRAPHVALSSPLRQLRHGIA